MRIFLVYPRILGDQYDQYNYGLGYISSVLKEGGHAVDYIVLKAGSDIVSLYKNIELRKPQIIGFSVTTSQFNHLHDIVKTIKKISNAFVLFGGAHPTFDPECIFEVDGLDAIVRGEGEFPMLDLLKAFERETSYFEIQNFWFKTKGAVVKNELRPLIDDLNNLPFPDKSSLDYQRAIDESGGTNRFIFSRGCKFKCPYCSNEAFTSLYKQTYFRTRSPQKAIEEIEQDASRYNFKNIFFDDDTIHLNNQWFLEFFTLYKKYFKYPFNCNIRPDIITSDRVEILKEAGAFSVNIGVEHGNEELRKSLLRRNMTNKQIIDAFELFKKHNIRCFAHLLVGVPFENKKLFLDTVRLCRELALRPQGINIFNPYPATELGELCKKYGWLPEKKKYKERAEATISYPAFSKEEIQLCRDVFPELLGFKLIPLVIPFKLILWFGKCVLLPQRLLTRLVISLKERSEFFRKLVVVKKVIFG